VEQHGGSAVATGVTHNQPHTTAGDRVFVPSHASQPLAALYLQGSHRRSISAEPPDLAAMLGLVVAPALDETSVGGWLNIPWVHGRSLSQPGQQASGRPGRRRTTRLPHGQLAGNPEHDQVGRRPGPHARCYLYGPSQARRSSGVFAAPWLMRLAVGQAVGVLEFPAGTAAQSRRARLVGRRLACVPPGRGRSPRTR
jgi:hypothetical protein